MKILTNGKRRESLARKVNRLYLRQHTLTCRKVFRTAKRIKVKVRARKMHEDKLKTPPANSTYRDNHQRIFGDPKGSEGIDEEVSRKLRLERHKNEVRLGKKDAQYYVDNEVRISADPNWQPKMEVSEAYKDGWNRIFNKP